MIVEKSEELLRKLREFNYKQKPDFGMDSISEEIISIIVNECKSTIFTTDDNGNIRTRRHESDIIKNNLHQIIRILIINGGIIPKHTMNSIMYSNGMILGVNSDIEIYKGVRENDDGAMEYTAGIGNIIIDFEKMGYDTQKIIIDNIYPKFARQFIIESSEQFPNLSKLNLLKEKIFHWKENKETIKQEFEQILKEQTPYGEEIIRATVDYYLEYMYTDRFKKNILQTINTGTGLVPIDVKGKKISFDKLLEAVSEETKDMMMVVPNINEMSKDIEQAYADVTAQLVAYSTDITKLNEEQIEDKIKQIDEISLIDPEMKAWVGESGYRQVNVRITKNDVKLVNLRKAKSCMKKLVKDIHELVQNCDNMSQEEYLKRAIQLKYRFIRIHPFPNSNGRTSRALLNMITIPKGILVEVKKEERQQYIKAQNDTHVFLDKYGYFEALNENGEWLDQIEADTVNDLPVYKYMMKKCIREVEEQTDNDTRKLQIFRKKESDYQIE